jgi:hypothetical protein
MNDQRPMLDCQARDRIGRKLGQDYARLPSGMPDRLQDLVAALLAADPSKQHATSAPIPTPRIAMVA